MDVHRSLEPTMCMGRLSLDAVQGLCGCRREKKDRHAYGSLAQLEELPAHNRMVSSSSLE